MSDVYAQPESGVTFKTPIGERMFTLLSKFLLVIFGCVIVAGVYWGAFVLQVWPQQQPQWVHAVGFLLLLGVPFFTIRQTSLAKPMTITIFADRVQFGGAILHRTFGYDELQLIKLDQIEHTAGRK